MWPYVGVHVFLNIRADFCFPWATCYVLPHVHWSVPVNGGRYRPCSQVLSETGAFCSPGSIIHCHVMLLTALTHGASMSYVYTGLEVYRWPSAYVMSMCQMYINSTCSLMNILKYFPVFSLGCQCIENTGTVYALLSSMQELFLFDL